MQLAWKNTQLSSLFTFEISFSVSHQMATVSFQQATVVNMSQCPDRMKAYQLLQAAQAKDRADIWCILMHTNYRHILVYVHNNLLCMHSTY